jgi:hypothetical protein
MGCDQVGLGVASGLLRVPAKTVKIRPVDTDARSTAGCGRGRPCTRLSDVSYRDVRPVKPVAFVRSDPITCVGLNQKSRCVMKSQEVPQG